MNFKKLAGMVVVLAGMSFSANSAVILATDFDGRVISSGSATATSVNWVANGVSALNSLTADSALFDTSDAQDMFAVASNIQTVGPWFTDIALNVMSNSISLDAFSIDTFIFNNGGSFQAANTSRDVDFSVSILDAGMSVIAQQDILNVYPAMGAYTPGQNISFDLSSVTLAANMNYILRLVASSNETMGNNAGIDDLELTGTVNVANVQAVSEPSVVAFFMMMFAGLYLRNKRA